MSIKSPLSPTPPATPDAAGGPVAKRDSLWLKIARVFAVATIGAFLTALLPIADKIANGEHVSFTALESLAVAVIVGAIAAGIRAVIAYLPLFTDDNNIGIPKR